MKKRIIYTNEDNEDFEVETYTYSGNKNVRLNIIAGSNELYFATRKEVEEFCRILMDEAKIAFQE
jgi:hypothetical protein